MAGKISPVLNSWSRFAFNLPFSASLVLVVAWLCGSARLSSTFFAYCFATAATQLLGNVALVAAFNHSNFAQSIVLHKLEVVMTAILGAWLFHEVPSASGWLGVLICTVGVLAINLGRDTGPSGWRRAFHIDTGTLLALCSALLLTLAAFMLKGASAEFVELNPRVGADRFEAASYTLFHSTWIEVVILSTWIGLRRREEFALVRTHWPRMLAVGFTGFAGSLGWYWAFSLTLAAYVKAVGQVESVLAVALAVRLWREREVWRQVPGIAMVLAGILLIVFG